VRSRKLAHFRALDPNHQLKFLRRAPNQTFVRVAAAPTQPMVQMSYAQFPVVFCCERVQRVQQHHRIHPA